MKLFVSRQVHTAQQLTVGSPAPSQIQWEVNKMFSLLTYFNKQALTLVYLPIRGILQVCFKNSVLRIPLIITWYHLGVWELSVQFKPLNSCSCNTRKSISLITRYHQNSCHPPLHWNWCKGRCATAHTETDERVDWAENTLLGRLNLILKWLELWDGSRGQRQDNWELICCFDTWTIKTVLPPNPNSKLCVAEKGCFLTLPHF